MSVGRWSIGWLAVAGLVCAAQSSDVHGDWATEALGSGTLTVWRVTNTAAPVQTALDLGYHEQTAGSFGRSAGSSGTAASDTGTSAGGFGKAASDSGQTSSTYGRTAGGFGQAAGASGQAAGSYGKAPSELGPGPGSASRSAGDYGQTSGSFGGSSGGVNRAASGVSRTSAGPDLVLDEVRQRSGYPASSMNVVSVAPNELRPKLNSAEGSDAYPDVLIGSPLPFEWKRGDPYDQEVVAPLGSDGIADPAEYTIERPPAVEAVLLKRAPHPDQARAYIVWLGDRGLRPMGPAPLEDKNLADAVSVAMRAAQSVLGGTKPTEADDDLAEFSSRIASALALQPSSSARTDGLQIRMDAVVATANARFAVVGLRAVLSAPEAFGVVHPLVVLRKGADGSWKALQISPNVGPRLLEHAYNMLARVRRRGPPEAARETLGISQASPVDGDNRTRLPDLWWDNGGGASLLVVEWQLRMGDDWADSHMDFVPDTEHRLRTRITADFAYRGGGFRWRVWSVSSDGHLQLSPWRRLNIVG